MPAFWTLYTQGERAWLGIVPDSERGPNLPNETIGVLGHEVKPDLNVVQWDPATTGYVARTTPSRMVLSRREFEQRWTVAERRHLKALVLNPATEVAIRAAIAVAEDELNRASAVELNLPATADNVGDLLDLIIATSGPVTTLTRAARLEAILAPVPA
jgi:hypothetical protein